MSGNLIFRVLGYRNKFICDVSVIKSDSINIKRKPAQIVSFKKPENFIQSLSGRSSVVVYVGREVKKEGDGYTVTNNWKAYYWEPSEPKKSYASMEGESLFPWSTLAILDMDTEYDLEWTLKRLQEEAKQWKSRFNEAERLSKQIYHIDRENQYADSTRFSYMTTPGLDVVINEMKQVLQELSHTKAVELEGEEHE